MDGDKERRYADTFVAILSIQLFFSKGFGIFSMLGCNCSEVRINMSNFL